MVADHIIQIEPGTYDEIRIRLGLTQNQFTTSLSTYAREGSDWMLVHAQDGPSIPITWADNRIMGACGRCGGTLKIAESGTLIKCSMCARSAVVAS